MLFSDIEGSTSLLSRLGDRFGDALDVHKSILRSAWAEFGGMEMGTEGDSFFVVFAVASDAVRAALQAQQELAAAVWPAGERVTVRMGLHTGEPMRHGDGYVGMDVHRAARVSAAAHGGQVVITAATRELVEEALPPGATVVDLGWHRFKDFALAMHVYQLGLPSLPDSFPPLRSLGATSSLPAEATTLVGRDGDLFVLQAVLGRRGARLVTLTGPGGSGKTRLATAVAATQAESFPDGVFFVPLSGVLRGDDMWTATMRALGLYQDGGERAQFLAQLAPRQLLMVLDNLEQIPDAADVVADLIGAAQRMVVVATSRRALHVVGEHEYPVPPLRLPNSADPVEILRSEAVQLFCSRAEMVRPGFALTTDNAQDVVAICERLDGLPLALELAAARTKVLSVAALRSRLGSSGDLRDLAVGRPTRQQTLRATIAWSYDLLPPELRATFRRLGVFAGGADLDAVLAVAMINGDRDALEIVTDLLDVSLTGVAEDPAGEPRIVLLQTVADFAIEQLVAEGELDDTRARHAQHYLTLAQTVAPAMFTGRAASARQRLQAEDDNFRATLTWALRPGEAAPLTPPQARLGLQLCAALFWYWHFNGQVQECRHWYERALEVDSGEDSPERATALAALPEFSNEPVGDFQALAQLEESLAISRRLEDSRAAAETLSNIAQVYVGMGDFDAAHNAVTEANSLAERCGDYFTLSMAVWARAELESELGNVARSIELYEEMQRLGRALGSEGIGPWAESKIAETLTRSGRAEHALERLRAASDDFLRSSNLRGNTNYLAAYAVAFARTGQAERAATMLGAHWGHFIALGLVIEPESEDEWMQQNGLAEARDSLGEARWDRALEVGRAFTTEQAFAYAASEETRAKAP